MWFVILVMLAAMFIAGVVVGHSMPHRKPASSLETRYRNALFAIGSGSAGNPQLEAQLALEQEEKK